MQISKVGVLGCGLMGSGVAQVCAMAGFDVTLLEVEQKFLDKGFAGIEKSLAKFAERPVEKGGITAEQKTAIRARLKGTTSKADLADCDIVVASRFMATGGVGDWSKNRLFLSNVAKKLAHLNPEPTPLSPLGLRLIPALDKRGHKIGSDMSAPSDDNDPSHSFLLRLSTFHCTDPTDRSDGQHGNNPPGWKTRVEVRRKKELRDRRNTRNVLCS